MSSDLVIILITAAIGLVILGSIFGVVLLLIKQMMGGR